MALILLFCVLLTMGHTALAAGTTGAVPFEIGGRAVVFLLDASNSMNFTDKNRLAIDCIAQMLCSLPSDYLASVVVYSDEIVFATDLADVSQRTSVVEQISALRYAGYTNAGAGIAKAVELLGQIDAEEKTIVLLSDGEIDMNTAEAAAESALLFQMAGSQAEQLGIRVHVIGVGEGLLASPASISAVAEQTSGVWIQISDAQDMVDAAEQIMLEQLHIKKGAGAIINTSGATDSLSLGLPFQGARILRILLTSPETIENLIFDFHGSDAKQMTGTHYTIVEITNQVAETINFQVQGQAGSQIRVDILPEYTVTAIPELVSDDASSEAHSIRVCFYNAERPNQQIFAQTLFENCTIFIKINGEAISAALRDGVLAFDYPASDHQLLALEFDFSNLPVNVVNRASAVLDVTAEPAHYGDFHPQIIIGIALAALVIAALVLFLCRPRKPVQYPPASPQPKKEPDSRYSYTGRLSIFITKTTLGHDEPPLSYNLFRLPSSRKISLGEILENCSIHDCFEGADNILLQPGVDRCLILTNQSDCTILRNQEILIRGGSYRLPINAKVDIVFEDEKSELTFQYKDLKPSEIRD